MQKWTIKLAAKDLQEASSRRKCLLTLTDKNASLRQTLKSFVPDSPVELALKQIKEMKDIDEAELNLIWMRADKLSWKVIVADKEFQCSRTTAWRRWKLVLNKICEYLNGQQRQQEVEHDAR